MAEVLSQRIGSQRNLITPEGINLQVQLADIGARIASLFTGSGHHLHHADRSVFHHYLWRLGRRAGNRYHYIHSDQLFPPQFLLHVF